MIPLHLEKQQNIRDLGGTETRSGHSVKRNKLIRSGRLSELSASDAALLLGAYRVRTIVDLRSSKENEERPDPQWGIVEYFRIPLLTDDQLGFGAFAAAGSPEGKRNVLDTLIGMTSGPSYSASQYLMDMYRKFITDRLSQIAIRRFFEVLLSHREGALLYHCNGGKDRTGMQPWLERKLKTLPEQYRTQQAKAVLRMLYLADAACLQAAYEEMCNLGESPSGYLTQVIGIRKETLEELRKRLLD